jgi:hypothetical protein
MPDKKQFSSLNRNSHIAALFRTGAIIMVSCMFAANAHACKTDTKYGNNCPESELGHVVGFTFVGAASTWLADKEHSQHRLWHGFLIGSSIGLLSEVAEQVTTDTHASPLDVASDMVGVAIGAIITDKFLLMPVVHKTDHGAQAGIRIGYAF